MSYGRKGGVLQADPARLTVPVGVLGRGQT
jgi:hypothetical protein